MHTTAHHFLSDPNNRIAELPVAHTLIAALMTLLAVFSEARCTPIFEILYTVVDFS